MPEIPDIVNYCEALEERLVGESIEELSVRNPFLLRTVEPPLDALIGTRVVGIERIGKRVVIAVEAERFLVIHLMIAGRFRWVSATPPARGRARKAPGGKQVLLVLRVGAGTLYLTEAGAKRRASLHVVAGRDALAALDPGGLEVQTNDAGAFIARVRSGNHTLKRVLTDPRILSGIGNAYSDEILHRARLSPLQVSSNVDDATLERLREAIHEVLDEWTERHRNARLAGDGFPDKVTAFHDAMAVHGRAGEPCPVCDAPVQRIVYASNETNYCARCQTNGVILKDRALSRLLKDSFPRRLED